MKQIRIEATLEYDDGIMHGDDLESRAWFLTEVLMQPMVLHSNEIGDEVATLQVVRIVDVC